MICALYFGSFNPLHTGHITIAAYVLQHCNIDELRFVLTPESPFKSGDSSLADEKKRLERLTRSIERFKSEFRGRPVKVSTVEFGMPKPNYTYNTLEYLRKSEPDNEFVIVMGADNISKIERWYKWQDILKRYKVLVYPRKGFDTEALCNKYGVTFLDAPLCDISSTMIRKMAEAGEDVNEFLY